MVVSLVRRIVSFFDNSEEHSFAIEKVSPEISIGELWSFYRLMNFYSFFFSFWLDFIVDMPLG